MARTKNKGIDINTDNVPGEVVERIADEQNLHARAGGIILDATEALLAAGRIQGMQFIATVSDVVIAQNFISIKKSKGYIGLPYQDSEGNSATVADLEEFCRAFFDKSYRRCQELAQNLNLLGTDLYQQAEQIGFRARDYQALKALPADEQEIIKQAIETQDREQVVELLQDMALKHKEERDADKNRNQETAADLEVTQRMLDEEKASHHKTRLDLQKTKRRIQTMTAEEADKELRQEAALVAYDAELTVAGNLREVCTTMLEHAEQSGTDYRPFLAGMVRQVEIQLAKLRDEFALPDGEGAEEFAFLGRDAD